MKKHATWTSLLMLFLPLLAWAQEDENPVKVNWYGYIKYEAYLDSRQSVSAREGGIYLWPKPVAEDANGDDLNGAPTLQMLSAQTRLGTKITGGEAFGAKITGVIEIDWLGTSNDYIRMPRLRHALMKMQWANADLLLGQYWHPMFVTEVFPHVLTFGAALPFQPFSRAPQARFTYKPSSDFSIATTALMHGYNKSAAGGEAGQANAVVPDLSLKVLYGSTSNFLAGFVAGYKMQKPVLVTPGGYKAENLMGAYNAQAFAKINTSGLSVALKGVYGQDLSNLTMLGGAGTKAGSVNAITGEGEYVPTNTLSAFVDVATKGKVQLGLFAGYSENLGADEKLASLDYGLGIASPAGDIASMVRVAPRAVFTSGNMAVGLELTYISATYVKAYDAYFAPEKTEDAVANFRPYLMVKYAF